jgi:hypothetical protein
LAGFEVRHIRDEALDQQRFVFFVDRPYCLFSVPFNINLLTQRFHQDSGGFNQTLDVEGIQVILELYVDKFFGCSHTLVFSHKVAG